MDKETQREFEKISVVINQNERLIKIVFSVLLIVGLIMFLLTLYIMKWFGSGIVSYVNQSDTALANTINAVSVRVALATTSTSTISSTTIRVNGT